MNILIASAGAVGGYYGCLLWKTGIKVSYLVTEKSLPVIRDNGITVKSKGEVWTFHPKVSVNPSDLTPCDLTIIGAKLEETGVIIHHPAASAAICNAISKPRIMMWLVPCMLEHAGVPAKL